MPGACRAYAFDVNPRSGARDAVRACVWDRPSSAIRGQFKRGGCFMTQRILGPEGSKRRWRFRYLSLPVIAAMAVALLLAGSAGAVHEFAFQLDGDVSAST